MDIKIKSYGKYNGVEYDEIFITNDNNVIFAFSNLGARITKLLYPYNGDIYNLVLGFNTAEEAALCKDYYYGATIGRVAGRIKAGQFTLDNNVYKLSLNDGGNHLHGGENCFDLSKWEYDIQKYTDKVTVSFYLEDEDGNNGYPGHLKVKVHHTVTNDNQWQIIYEGIADKNTLFDPTNHVYFNLNKEEDTDILNHKLKVNAQYYVPVDKNTLPLNNGETVEGTVFNFTQSQLLSNVLKSDNQQIKLMNGLDHAFIFTDNNSSSNVCLENIDNTIKVKMKTDRPAVVIFTHNKTHENLPLMKKKHVGITLEAQSLPNSINIDSYRNKVILRKDEKFESITTYTFYHE